MSLFSKLVVATLPIIPKSVVKMVARRYIAGPFLDDAVRTTQDLMRHGACSTIDVLGEFVTSRDRAVEETAMSRSVVDAIKAHDLDSYLSVKLTSLGLDIDEEFCFANLRSIVDRAREVGVFVRMDMENTPYTDKTLTFYRRLRDAGYDNVGVVLQAYLKRTEGDVHTLLPYKPSVRLCKGIYIEPEELAYRDANAIRASYQRLLDQLLDGGADVRMATHDEELLQLDHTTMEFQMLLGVREDRRDNLLAKGYRVRIYVPFGEDWYGYSTRRLKENPQIAAHVAKAFLTRA
jgi:proline dehydrogenase